MSAPVIAVVGPTASGKSDLALDLAQALDAEIINADAMQLYRGMDIGTAKLAAHERRGIPHHQLDVLEVDQDATVAAYQSAAREVLAAIHSRGHAVVVVGGSGLYVRALLDDLDFPGTHDGVRSVLEERAAHEGPGVLHDELTAKDPEAAARIDRRNPRRIIRALEVIEITGRPYSANLPTHTYLIPAVQIGIDVPRPELGRRIEARAHGMFSRGLLEETTTLLGRGLERGRTARRAVGYAQALAVLHGESGVPQAVESTAVATRQLARRQMTWFGRDPRVHWLEPGADLVERARRLLP
ncbi:MAG: tRNA (adenosine(37)-N6)-dimethylallyltransferase MiaA [Actinomycetales bacterium]|nr:tRNA (adenosine(37)-N6)-dimethylallyltransferase MiaA [Actinomycetales bacterium]